MTVKGELTELVGQSPAIQALLATVERLSTLSKGSGRPPSVLIQGETGSGKGLVASLLHRASSRATGRFVDVNCAAIPENLIEAELFGFERGAFTDARRAKPGLFQEAHRGTIFLDEVGLLPESLQPKLLKVIEERVVRRLGSTENEPVDAWIITATNADLLASVRAGRFREDLYHRLAVVTVALPPLRERAGDIVLLANHFLARASADHGVPPRVLTPEAVARLEAYHWPGNVRELANVMERVALLSEHARVDAATLHLPVSAAPATAASRVTAAGSTLDDVVRAHIQEVLEQTSGNISRTAALLGISRNTLRAHLDKLGLRPTSTRTRDAAVGRAAAPSVSVPDSAPVGPAVPAPARALRWERRLITVLRVVLDAPPETPPFQLAPVLEELIAKVKSFSARVEEVTPLGLLAVFGLEPMEDAPSRATHAALAMLKAVERARSDVVSGLHARLAIHAGARLIAHGGDVTGMDPAERGEVWTILERLVVAAPADAIVVDSAAAPLIERRFALDPPRGTTSPPPELYRVVGHERTGFEVGGRVLSGFVGRDQDLALLRDRLAHAESGRGQVVGIASEPGVGKSRLLYEFHQSLGPRRVTWVEGRCPSYGTTTPYAPIIDLVRHNFRLAENDAPAMVAEKLTTGLGLLGLEPKLMTPNLLHLLGFKEGTEGLAGLSPEAVKARTMDTLWQVVLAGSRRRPIVIAVEDLHWIDSTSEAALAALADKSSGGRLLLVVTYRPGYQPPWLGRSHASQMALGHLSPADSLRVVHSVVSEETLPTDLAATIVDHAGGVPFFLEELARAVAEHPDLRSELQVPDTIHGVLTARLDRLPDDERSLLQTASVIGKDVDLALLGAVTDLAEPALRRGLAHLQAAEFVHETAGTPRRVYTFKHALTQDVAYHSLPEDVRRRLHVGVAAAIERLTPDVRDRQPEMLAHHYTAGGRIADAVRYWHRAGQYAIQRSANVEAVAHLRKGLELVESLPASAERVQQELVLQTALSRALVMTKGFGAPEVGRALARARELCRPLGEAPEIFPVLFGLWLFYIGRADFTTAEELASNLLAIADRQSSDKLRMVGHVAAGVPLFYRGELGAAIEQLRAGLALYDVADSSMQLAAFGQDQGVGGLGFLGWALALTGRCDEAALIADQAIALGRQIGHPFSLTLALDLASIVRMWRGEPAQAGVQGEEELTLSREHGFAYFAARGLGFVGWSLIAAGERDRGLEMMRQGARAYRATGAAVGLSHLAHLAGVLVEMGQSDEALEIVADALGIAGRTGEGAPLAELHRVRGAALLRQHDRDEGAADVCFQDALAVARRQGARWLELRAATSLARLWARQGRRDEARALLAPLHASFTEGLACADLKAARAALQELG